MPSTKPFIHEDEADALLKPDGKLSFVLKEFEPRLSQQNMARNILRAYNDSAIALIEAGTGTGKTMAYLIPAVLWALRHKERTVISTNTINLQEQLIHKDIPLLTKALNVEVKAVLVKGINNYLCLRKLKDTESELRLLPLREADEIDKIIKWKEITEEGSRSELPFVPTAGAWERINAESDTCTHKQCPHYQQCYFFKARQKASDAQILVVNHHLLFADISRRAATDNYENPCVLPYYKHIVLDEAHNIEDVATEYFADKVSRVQMSRILSKLASDTRGRVHGKLPLLKERLINKFETAFEKELGSIINRLTNEILAEKHNLLIQVAETFQSFVYFFDSLKPSLSTDESDNGEKKLRVKSEQTHLALWKQEILPQAHKLASDGQKFIQAIRSLLSDVFHIPSDKIKDACKDIAHDIYAFTERFEGALITLCQFISEHENPFIVRWIDSQKSNAFTNVHLVMAKLEIAPLLAETLFNRFSTIVLCSATLTTNQQFTFMRQRLGITTDYIKDKPITENIYDSPFNYSKQALLTIPTDIPDPTDPAFIEAANEQIWMAIQASRGNAFVLFTSYAMLQTCYQKLAPKLQNGKFQIFKQGDDNRRALLKQFKEKDRSVLFGTDSFWEGVDVAGEALRCVIIVKLPFKVPSDPLIQARTEAISAQGGNAFMDYSIPNAIVKFKQGFGRLIRNKNDRGCIVCLDGRLINKRYGAHFLNSLPKCQEAFVKSEQIHQEMSEFYRKTYYLIANK